MKKTLLTLSIAAVFAVGASAAEFKAGTYTAKAPGIHGDVTVTVTFTKDKIADVKVTHSETPGIGSKAAELLPGRIVERQSPQVDGVTGNPHGRSRHGEAGRRRSCCARSARR